MPGTPAGCTYNYKYGLQTPINNSYVLERAPPKPLREVGVFLGRPPVFSLCQPNHEASTRATRRRQAGMRERS